MSFRPYLFQSSRFGYSTRRMSLWTNALVFNGLIVVAIWFAAFLAEYLEQKKEYVRLVVSFSAGVVLGVCFLHMIPEAVEHLGNRAGGFVLAGFLLVYLLERFVMVHPCEEGACDYHSVGIAAFLGLSLHSLINGLALGSALLIPGLGFAVFFATVIHKGPESFSLTSLLILGNRNRTKVLTYLVAFSAMVPVGTAIAILGLGSIGDKAIGAAVAFSAGTFLQIATGDLLPETHEPGAHRFKGLGFFIAGIGLTMLSSWVGR